MRSARHKKRGSEQMHMTYTSGQFGADKILTPIKERHFHDNNILDQTKYNDFSQEPITPQSNMRAKGVYMQNQETSVYRPTPDD